MPERVREECQIMKTNERRKNLHPLHQSSFESPADADAHTPHTPAVSRAPARPGLATHCPAQSLHAWSGPQILWNCGRSCTHVGRKHWNTSILCCIQLKIIKWLTCYKPSATNDSEECCKQSNSYLMRLSLLLSDSRKTCSLMRSISS